VLNAPPRPELTVSFSDVEVCRTIDDTAVALELTGRRAGGEVLSALPGLPDLDRLSALGLHSFPIRADLLEALIRRLSTGLLRELDLSDNDLGDHEAEILARLLPVPGLEVLVLARNLIKARGAATLARSPALAGLRVLDLSGNSLGQGGVDALTSSPHLGKLDRLILRGVNLTLRERQVFGARLRGKVEFL
jgi:hypothetical protein